MPAANSAAAGSATDTAGLSALTAPPAQSLSAIAPATQVPTPAPDFTQAPGFNAPATGLPAAAPGLLPYSNGQASPLSDTTDLRSQIPQSADALRGPIANNSPLKFELKQIKPTLKDVQLKVSLRNDSNEAIQIPANLQAVIKYNNQTESELKVAFDDKSIAPHGTVDGVVKVPFNKVDPSADLVLRNMLPASNQELHIIKTAISQK